MYDFRISWVYIRGVVRMHKQKSRKLVFEWTFQGTYALFKQNLKHWRSRLPLENLKEIISLASAKVSHSSDKGLVFKI